MSFGLLGDDDDGLGAVSSGVNAMVKQLKTRFAKGKLVKSGKSLKVNFKQVQVANVTSMPETNLVKLSAQTRGKQSLGVLYARQDLFFTNYVGYGPDGVSIYAVVVPLAQSSILPYSPQKCPAIARPGYHMDANCQWQLDQVTPVQCSQDLRIGWHRDANCQWIQDSMPGSGCASLGPEYRTDALGKCVNIYAGYYSTLYSKYPVGKLLMQNGGGEISLLGNVKIITARNAGLTYLPVSAGQGGNPPTFDRVAYSAVPYLAFFTGNILNENGAYFIEIEPASGGSVVQPVVAPVTPSYMYQAPVYSQYSQYQAPLFDESASFDDSFNDTVGAELMGY